MYLGNHIYIRYFEAPQNRWKNKNNVKMKCREMCSENGRWMKLDQDHIRLWALVVLLVNFRVVLFFVI
jgi:hypothetical protein